MNGDPLYAQALTSIMHPLTSTARNPPPPHLRTTVRPSEGLMKDPRGWQYLKGEVPLYAQALPSITHPLTSTARNPPPTIHVAPLLSALHQRKCNPLEPYRSPMPGVPREVRFLMGEVPLYAQALISITHAVTSAARKPPPPSIRVAPLFSALHSYQTLLTNTPLPRPYSWTMPMISAVLGVELHVARTTSSSEPQRPLGWWERAVAKRRALRILGSRVSSSS